VLNSPLTDSEVLHHLKAAPPDKSPGVDGISNHMLQAGGPGTFLKVYMELGSSFLFLQEQMKDIIINLQNPYVSCR
jgi:hypothetical protein